MPFILVYNSRGEGRRSGEDRPWRSRSPIGSRRHREHDAERVRRVERVKGNGDAEVKRDYRDGRDEKARRRSPGVSGRRGGKGHVPSYVVSPAKWKKYDLSTDGSEELVREGLVEDEVNRHAAFEFLKEAREQRESERMEDMEKEGEVGGVGAEKVVFTKPSQLSSSRRRGSGAGREEGCVARDEECVSGHGGGTRKKRAEQGVGPVGRKRTSAGISLSHLAEEEEEEED